MAAPAHLTQYDPVLRPVAAAYRDAPPHLALRAIACRAHAEGIPRAALRTWLISRCPGPVADVARNRALFGHLYADTARRVRRTSSLDGRRRLATQTARAVVAYLCSPMPNPEAARQVRTQARARAALAVLAPEFLRRAVEDGYDTIIAPAPRLSVALGCSTNSAARALTACVDAGWLVRKRSRPGSAQRYALRLRLTGGRGRVAWEHADLVDALADGEDHPWVRALALASHP
ncbi:MAG: hypothetical protein Q8Q02_16815, partial [Nocardioides sp.]|nr:hypothetical protein [Nocardioides sp.]